MSGFRLTSIAMTGPPPQVLSLAGKKDGPYKQGELSGVLKELGYTADQVGSTHIGYVMCCSCHECRSTNSEWESCGVYVHPRLHKQEATQCMSDAWLDQVAIYFEVAPSAPSPSRCG